MKRLTSTNLALLALFLIGCTALEADETMQTTGQGEVDDTDDSDSDSDDSDSDSDSDDTDSDSDSDSDDTDSDSDSDSDDTDSDSDNDSESDHDDAGCGGGDTCAGTADFDFRVAAADLGAWEGAAVTVAATENADFPETGHARVVLQSTAILDGAFSVFCPNALRETLSYPSIGAFIDVDGNGVCNDGDRGAMVEMYGWVADLSLDLEAMWWQEVGAAGGSLHAPIGSSADDFCSAYFE